jgi:hypothetical protein
MADCLAPVPIITSSAAIAVAGFRPTVHAGLGYAAELSRISAALIACTPLVPVR